MESIAEGKVVSVSPKEGPRRDRLITTIHYPSEINGRECMVIFFEDPK